MNGPPKTLSDSHELPPAREPSDAATILDSLSAHIVVLDADLAIVQANATWHTFVLAHGAGASCGGVGNNYLTALSSMVGLSDQQASAIANGVRSVLHGEHPMYQTAYAWQSPTGTQWRALSVTPIAGAGNARLVIADTNVSQLMGREASRAATFDHHDSLSGAAAESARFVRAVTDALPAMVAYWDSDLRCRFANSRYKEWFGKSADVVVGMHMRELLGEKLFALNEVYIRGALAGQPQNFERTLTKADGSIGHTWANYLPDRKPDGAVAGFFVLVSDVTPLKNAEAKLRLAASVIANTSEAIVVADANGRVESVNPAYTRITGFREDEVIGTKQHIFAVKDAASVPPEALQLSLDTEGHWQGEVWNRRKNGESFLEWKSLSKIVDANGRLEHYVSVFNDITDYWRRDEEVRRLAFHDALTDLPNRALLTERLTQLLAMAQREKRNLAVLFMDLDGFKHVNDTLGHEVGDHVLIAAARHLQALVRAADTVARVGGDEFVVVLDNPQDNDEVALIATRIIDQVNEPLTINGRTVQVGTSIGIAIHPTAGRTVDELVRSADAAMYAAKKAGKNAFKFAGSPQL
jgi:diguanylate cyclase (GGDEF)-like protein/PAS domain S-box-containing protein